MTLHQLPIALQVLIVEDEAIARRALASLLRFNGYTTQVAASAEEAIGLANQLSQPAVALIDLDLPGMNGMDLIRLLKQTRPNITPILITATSGERLSFCLRACPVDYLRKPLNLDRLFSLLERAAPCDPESLEQ